MKPPMTAIWQYQRGGARGCILLYVLLFPTHLFVELGYGVEGQGLRPRNKAVLFAVLIVFAFFAAWPVLFVDELHESAQIGGSLTEVPANSIPDRA